MNLLVLIMSNLFLQVSSQPAICLFFFYYAVTLVWQTQPAPAPRTGDQQPARSGGAQDRRPAASQDRRQSSQPGPVVWTGDNAAKGSPGMRTNKTCIVQKKINIRAKTSI
jgi:hypothetical protein